MNRRALLGAMLFLLPGVALSAPPSVVSGSGTSVASVGQVSAITLPAVTVAAGPDQTLVVCVGTKSEGSLKQVLTVARDGVALTKVAHSDHAQSSSVRVEAWVLDDPSAGAFDVAVTTQGGHATVSAYVVAGTAGIGRNVKKADIPPAPAGYTPATSLILADAGAEALLTDCIDNGSGIAITATAAGQTAIPGTDRPGGDQHLGSSSRVGPGALAWSATAGRWGHVLLEFLPAVATPPVGGGACSCTSESFTPTDGLVSVTDEAFGATCDGTADDTGGMLAAIRRHGASTLSRNSLKIPNAACKVSDTLKMRRPEAECSAGTVNCWLANVGLFGSGPQAEIRLADHALNYCTALLPKPVIYTASLVEGNDPTGRRANGAGAKAFQNEIFDMTISTGSGNPGAIGVDWINSNHGGMRRVTIKSEDGQGVAGILATRYGQGPGLWDQVAIAGFDRCIDLGEFDYGMTGKHIDCDYNVEGIRITSNEFAVRKLTTNGTGPAIRVANANAYLVLLDSVLTCSAPPCAGPAIESLGKVFLRNVECPGFASCLPATGTTVAEYASHGPFSAFAADARASLNLPIKDAPRAANPKSHSERVNCAAFGAGGEGNASPGIAAAIGTGKPIVYCPSTTGYGIGDMIDVPASTRVLDFLGASAKPPTGVPSPPALFRVSENSEEPLHIRRIWASGYNDATRLVHRPAGITRTVVVEDSAGPGFLFEGPGDVFLSDVLGLVDVRNGASVWADQLDLEGNGTYIKNDGAKLWALGIKTERANQISLTTGGGCTEILGGLVYVTEPPPVTRAAHEVIDGAGFFLHAGTTYSAPNRFEVLVRETRGAVTAELLRPALPSRGLGVSTFGSAHEGGCTLS